MGRLTAHRRESAKKRIRAWAWGLRTRVGGKDVVAFRTRATVPMSGTGEDGGPRLLVDEMLGRLARWLRVLGYDAVWERGLDDADLLARAEREGRWLLTRDTLLMERRAVRRGRVHALFVNDDRLDDQLRQLRRDMGLARVGEPRCLVCNGRLTRISREQALPRVPPYVAGTQSAFRYCSACDRVVWPGTHWEAMLRVLRRAGIHEGEAVVESRTGAAEPAPDAREQPG